MTSSDYPRLTESVNQSLLEGITTRRLGRFLGGPFAGENLSSALELERVHDEQHVWMRLWSAPPELKISFSEARSALSRSSQRYEKGTSLGPSFTNHWVHVMLQIPQSFRVSSEPIIFEFDPGCEALIFNAEGEVLHGITGGPNSSKDGVPGTQEDRRVEHLLPDHVKQHGTYECYIEISANSVFGEGSDGYRHHPPNMNKYYPLVSADLVLVNAEGRALELDFQSLRQIAQDPQASTSSISQRALKSCNDIMNQFTRRIGDEQDGSLARVIRECRQISQSVLGRLDEVAIQDLTTYSPACTPNAKLWAIGHCHIDTAWLWRYTQTHQKIARSWSTQCDLMDRFPNYKFAASSAQHYVWLKEYYPQTFERVAKYVSKGQFAPVGGAWLEHDCMIPSGESFVRQYLYGQQYFQSTFGAFCREAWLPDTFGYASQLPQILRLCGIDYFFTQKLSWNNINTFPHSTFNWCGIDGSQVLAHMTPTDTYNAQCDYSEIMKGVRNHKNLAVTQECLLLYGNGDGGGGPTPRMLEKLQRLCAVAQVSPEVPAVKVGLPVDFFEKIRKETLGGRTLPTWRGELYFELHRGTYTSQARIKEGNRTMERLLRELEYFATIASITSQNYEYPKDEIDAIWKDVMLNQFHDVIPGTSIRLANEDAWAIYDTRSEETEQLIENALATLTQPAERLSDSSEEPLTIIDALCLMRSEVIELSAGPKLDSTTITHQLIETDSTGIGAVVGACARRVAPKAMVVGEHAVLENAHFRLEFKDGRLKSLFDIPLRRELIVPGPGADDAGLMLYDDYPLAYDAWDAEIYHLDQCRQLKFTALEVTADNALRASISATAVFGKSKVTLTFSLDAVVPQATERCPIRVDVQAEWQESHRFLKFALPLDIHFPSATYGTQFGLIERPTHRNTRLDQAKFEVCAHMLADLSEVGYGVTITSDHKYGYAVENNTMRISLLRSAKAPDADMDMGSHRFSFAIIPHVARMQESGVLLQALKFTNPVRILPGRIPGTALSLLRWSVIDAPSVRIETVKRGEQDETSGHQTIVLRILETLGSRVRGSLRLSNLSIHELHWTNLLEEPIARDGETVTCSQDMGTTRVELNMRGFEIKTLVISLGV